MNLPVLPGQPRMPNADHASPTRWAMWLLTVGFGGFVLWASLAPLDEGVPTPGVVDVDTKRKRVEHLMGGLVERILVKEGQRGAGQGCAGFGAQPVADGVGHGGQTASRA